MAATKTYNKIDCLTSLRFIAVAMIVVHHSRGVLWLTPENLKHFALDQAVSFFFVLSGFVLAYVYPRFNGPSSVKTFFVARFARIWPTHVAAFLTLFVMFLPYSFYSITEPNNAMIAVANLLLFQGWYPAQAVFFSFNAVTWAVSVEVFFYLVFPLLIRDFENTWLLKLFLSVLLTAAVISASNILQLPYAPTVPSNVISRTGLVYINPLCRLFEFVTGMSVALLWKKYAHRIRLGRETGTLLEAAVLLTAIVTIYLSVSADSLSFLVGPAGSEYLSHAGSTVPFALLIFTIALQRGYISALLSSRILTVLGEASYCIFLFHQLILRYYSVHGAHLSGVPKPLLYTLFWICTLVVSFLALFFIERPCRRLITRFFLGSKLGNASLPKAIISAK